jgi:signal transduction histidine kinase
MAAPLPVRDDGEPLKRGRPGKALLVEEGATPLSAAAARLVERWNDLATGWMATREEASEALDAVVRGVESIRSGQGPRDYEKTAVPARPLLHHRLSEALLVELLGDWNSSRGVRQDHSASEILELISALDEYRTRLWPGGQEDPTSRLAEPDAFELVVEMAHDIRSPLNSILFLSEVLRSGQSGPVSDHQRRQLGLIYSATLGMISVVSDVMDLATEYKGVADEEPAPFSLGQVFESVEEMVSPMADEKGIDLRFRVPEYDRYVGHPGPLGRVLLNLTTNALKFTEKGRVTVGAEKVARHRLRFSVEDTGRGISAEGVEQIFHPFRKSENRSGYFFSGSGLGLSIVRRLVLAMDSELEIETELGVGTRISFEVELPPASTL